MNPYICSICGSDTSNVDYDYLVNYDHISCHLGVWGGKDVPTNKSKSQAPAWVFGHHCLPLCHPKPNGTHYLPWTQRLRQLE